jgi:single-stranded DNA-binding protein
MLTIQAVGNLVIEPKLVNLKDFKIVETRIAVTKSKDKTIYLDVKFKNNKAGEILLQHAKKGSSVSVWGVLDEETWGTGDAKKSKIVIEADGFRFAGGGKSDAKKPVEKSTHQEQQEEQGDGSDVPF